MAASARLAVEQQATQQAVAAAASATAATQGATPPTPGAAPAAPPHAHALQHQQQQSAAAAVAASKDLFLVNLFGLCVAGQVAGADVAPAARLPAGVAASAFVQHVLISLAAVARHLDSAGAPAAAAAEGADATANGLAGGDDEGSAGGVVSMGSCRYACHCCFIHDSPRPADSAAAARAAARLLGWAAGAEGVNAAEGRDGVTGLQTLAAAGPPALLAAFVQVRARARVGGEGREEQGGATA
jgi:hypothetical protein